MEKDLVAEVDLEESQPTDPRVEELEQKVKELEQKVKEQAKDLRNYRKLLQHQRVELAKRNEEKVDTDEKRIRKWWKKLRKERLQEKALQLASKGAPLHVLFSRFSRRIKLMSFEDWQKFDMTEERLDEWAEKVMKETLPEESYNQKLSSLKKKYDELRVRFSQKLDEIESLKEESVDLKGKLAMCSVELGNEVEMNFKRAANFEEKLEHLSRVINSKEEGAKNYTFQVFERRDGSLKTELETHEKRMKILRETFSEGEMKEDLEKEWECNKNHEENNKNWADWLFPKLEEKLSNSKRLRRKDKNNVDEIDEDEIPSGTKRKRRRDRKGSRMKKSKRTHQF